jgi:Ca2+-transporting ATPase
MLQIGNKTECAMLGFIESHGANYESIRQRAQIHKVYSFTSERKRMSTIVNYSKHPAVLGSDYTAYRIYTKGASEIVLGLCTNYVNDDGTIVPLDASVMEELNAHINDMASSGLRTICIAYADFPRADDAWNETPPEFELTCIALVGIKDPVRPEVPKSVRQCQRAGITVRMVTGDNIATAKTIARECGILTEGGIAMEGSEFRNLSEQQLDLIIPKLQVLARSSPIDKFTLVKRLKELGEVVAVTGDGTNDAPALNEAHIGLAMGIAGTDVAKEASDIIILDDNFSSIVSAVMWGRCVYDNIRKFLQFQLTINVVALITAFLAAVTDRGLPLKTVQLLWVNLIMDTLAALALGTETPTPDLLDRKPYGAKDSLINVIMIRNICMQAGYQLLVLLGLLYAGPELLNLPVPDGLDVDSDDPNKRAIDTIIFNTFVFCQLFNEFNARVVTQKLNVFKGIHTNPIFLGVIVFTAILQFLLVQFGGSFVETYPLDAMQWGICVALGFGSLPVGFIGRLIPIEKIVARFFPKKANERTPLLAK